MLRLNDSGPQIARYQDALRDRGYNPGPPDDPDNPLVGIYGPLTAAATVRAQTDIGFPINGNEAAFDFVASLYSRQMVGVHQTTDIHGGVDDTARQAAANAHAAASSVARSLEQHVKLTHADDVHE